MTNGRSILIATALTLAFAGCAGKTEVAQSTAAPTPAATESAAAETGAETGTPPPSAVDASTESPLPSEASTGSPLPAGSPRPGPSVTGPSPKCSPGAGVMTASYFRLPEKHPDVAHGIDGGIVTGLVADHLGPDGWPVATTVARTGSQASGQITDVNAAGEILWWSTTSRHGVKLEKIVNQCMPIENDAMFPSGYTDDATYFRTAHYQGLFTTQPGASVGFSLGSDDDSWVFVDDVLTVDNGGVKPLATAPYKTANLAAGVHTIDIFYADRDGGNAQLELEPKFPVAPLTASVAVATPTAAKTPAPIAKQLKSQRRIRLYGIHFDVDKATIQPRSEPVIAEIAKIMRDDPTWRFRVEGHTDSDGGYAHNVVLSQKRAQAVVNDLVSRYRIAPSRLVAKGYWYSHPVAPNTTPSNKALNRRVELVRL